MWDASLPAWFLAFRKSTRVETKGGFVELSPKCQGCSKGKGILVENDVSHASSAFVESPSPKDGDETVVNEHAVYRRKHSTLHDNGTTTLTTACTRRTQSHGRC